MTQTSEDAWKMKWTSQKVKKGGGEIVWAPLRLMPTYDETLSVVRSVWAIICNVREYG